jgi:hypothetical protein
MIEFGGSIYYIDLDALEKAIKPIGIDPMDKVIDREEKAYLDADGKVTGSEITEVSRDRGREIDGAKYEMIRLMMEILMDGTEETDDDTLGADRALEKTSLSYKIAFNTLYNYGILKEQE